MRLTFLDLPGEIRNEIYSQLLIIPSLTTSRLLGDPAIYPQILIVCQRIHEEAKQILYGCNTFLAHYSLLTDMPRLRPYYDAISHQNLISMIRRYHIHVRLDCDPFFSASKAQESFSGMDELTIEVSQAQFGSSDYKVLTLFEGVRGVKRAKLYGSVSAFPEYVNWLQDAMMCPKEIAVVGFENGEADSFDSYDLWTVSGNLTSFGNS